MLHSSSLLLPPPPLILTVPSSRGLLLVVSLSLSIHPLSTHLSSLLSQLVCLRLHVRLYLPAWLHLCPPFSFSISNTFMSPQLWQPPRGVERGWEGGSLLSQSHTDTWVKPGRTTLKITWWSDSPLQPSVPSLIPPLCSSQSAGRAAVNVLGESWQRRCEDETFCTCLTNFFPESLLSSLYLLISHSQICHCATFFLYSSRASAVRRRALCRLTPAA